MFCLNIITKTINYSVFIFQKNTTINLFYTNTTIIILCIPFMFFKMAFLKKESFGPQRQTIEFITLFVIAEYISGLCKAFLILFDFLLHFPLHSNFTTPLVTLLFNLCSPRCMHRHFWKDI